ncbi:MAG: hypothetical protein U9Q30_06925 [Campylobacterota bacterium]|nr:hypothetical protein [Campylobacterota bacterium]
MRNFIYIFLIISLNINLFGNRCLQCHPNKMQQCENSNHFTMKNSINITRKTWGIKDSNVTLQTLPKSKIDIEKPADLVDDFLRRKCLKCHLQSKTVNKTDNLCLACHNQHNNKLDAFKSKPTQEKCLKCHNNEYIGTDYLGLFPHDYDKAYRSPISKKGYYPKRPYGIDFHHLEADIHHKKGMSCIDCHKNSKTKKWEDEVNCKSCHTNISKKNHLDYHNNLSCSSCHSAWNISSYELNVLRDDTPNYKQWKRLKVQEDIYLENFLNKAIKSKQIIKPVMPDYITNELKDGIWYSGWRFRRWENFFLINSEDGKIKIAKPMYQYRISYKDKNSNIIMDDINKIDGEKIEVFLPKEPHTISKKAKSCEMCHENKIMLDDNLIYKDILQGKVLKGSKFTKEQLERLNSSKYKLQRAKYFYISH